MMKQNINITLFLSKTRYLSRIQYLSKTRYFIFTTLILSAYFFINGCSRAVVVQQPIKDQDRAKIEIKEQVKIEPQQEGVKPYDPSVFKKPIEYFNGITPSYPLHKLSKEQYPDFSKDIHGKKGLKRALKQSIIYYGRVPKSTKFYFGDDKYDAAFMRLSAKRFLDFLETSPSSYEINSFINNNYSVYTTVRRGESQTDSYQNGKVRNIKQYSNNPNASKEIDLSVLFTGYYEPSLQGSLIKEGDYIYPIYSKPNNLIEVPRGGFSGKYRGTPASGARRNSKKELIPYYTRAEIDLMGSGFEKYAKPLAWVNSKIDRFFLEIQGSGRVELKQGGTLRVQYSAKNGRPYRSIGKYLADKGEMRKEDVTMQSLRKWLKDNPERVDEVLNHNPSFVFFKKGDGGPVGCLGVEVTRMRSIATDKALLPKGAICFMETTIPTWASREDNIAWQHYSAFVLNQDTGGAIKGSGRADYFCGHGNYAQLAAGYMKQIGRLYFLVLKR
ncbi:MAG: MltA domain-containing protein [Desulfamplus sp.]|nr:MltA domain-containing protein [Desulfamplus sp.]